VSVYAKLLDIMVQSGFIEFKLDYLKTSTLAVDDAVISDELSAGGHVWRVFCYPHEKANEGHLSLYLQLVSDGARNVRAIFDAFLVGRDGAPSASHAQRSVHVYPPDDGRGDIDMWGFPAFVRRSVLEAGGYVAADGRVTFMCGVIVCRVLLNMQCSALTTPFIGSSC
jgi:speckle-type POZ protein